MEGNWQATRHSTHPSLFRHVAQTPCSKHRRGNRRITEDRRCCRLVSERGFAAHTQAFGLNLTLQTTPARRRRQRPTGGANVQYQPDRRRKCPPPQTFNTDKKAVSINPTPVHRGQRVSRHGCRGAKPPFHGMNSLTFGICKRSKARPNPFA